MTDPNHPDLEKQIVLDLDAPQDEKPMTARQRNAARQRAWRERQAAQGRRNVTFNVTDDEQFYLARVLATMRLTGAVPSTARDRKGRFVHIDT